MIVYTNTITNARGDSLPNYRAAVVDSDGASVTIYADKSGTRFTDDAGNTVDYATASSTGKVKFYWTAATGQVLQILDVNGNLVDATADFADNFVLDNLPGDIAQSAVTGLVTDLAAKVATADLASTAAAKGAALVGWIRGLTGSVARTVLAWITDQPISLEDFGGGTSKTAAENDTAWALLKAQIGGTNSKSMVQFADGTYQTALGFDLPAAAQQITLRGRGKGRTIIKCTDPTKHIITLPDTGTPHSINIFDMELNGSASAAAAGNGIYHGGANAFYGLLLERVRFKEIANDAVHLISAFTFKATDCDVTSAYGHGFYGGGNTWKFDTCYVHTLPTALKAGWRITGGTVVFDNCNGVDSGSIWADLGMSTVAAETPDGVVDAAAGYCRATFIGCNLEDFSAHGIWVRGGSINLHNTAIVAPSTGTVTAISGQYGNSQGGYTDRHPTTGLTTKGASWTNGYAIHSRSALPPFGLVATNSNSADNTYSFYNDAGATAVVMPVVRSRQINSTRMAHELKDLYVSGQFKTEYNGTATLSAGTVAVSFATARTSATYRILLTGSTAETFTWASKATTGFTINSSNAGSTASVDWFVVE